MVSSTTQERPKLALERELAAYKQKLPELREDEGKFALVHGDSVEVYVSYEDAIKEGYAKFGLQPFLVKQIHVIEQPQFISRLITMTSAHRAS